MQDLLDWRVYMCFQTVPGCRYSDVIMDAIASQTTSLTIVYSTVYSSVDQRKHVSSASLTFCGGNSPVTGEFPAQMTSNAENVSIWWRHHDATGYQQPSWGINHDLPKIVLHGLYIAVSDKKVWDIRGPVACIFLYLIFNIDGLVQEYNISSLALSHRCIVMFSGWHSLLLQLSSQWHVRWVTMDCSSMFSSWRRRFSPNIHNRWLSARLQ